jgi:hypothetical protein
VWRPSTGQGQRAGNPSLSFRSLAAIGMVFLLAFTVFVRRYGHSSNRRGQTKDLAAVFQHVVYDRMPNTQKQEETRHAVSRPGKHLRPSWRYGCSAIAPPTENATFTGAIGPSYDTDDTESAGLTAESSVKRGY